MFNWLALILLDIVKCIIYNDIVMDSSKVPKWNATPYLLIDYILCRMVLLI